MDKSVLLIAPEFFSYSKHMVSTFRELGYTCDLIDTRPTNSNLFKAVSRVSSEIVIKQTVRYFNDVIKKIELKEYSHVILIRDMSFCFNEAMLKELKESQKNANFVMYLWDAVRNLKDISWQFKYFHYIYSFERDANIYGCDICFLPLFYTDVYAKVNKIPKIERYNCVYVGTAHPLKYKNIKAMSEQLEKHWKSQYIYHYMPSKLKFYYQKLTSEMFRNAKLSEFQYNKVSEDDIIKLLNQTWCVLDSPQSNQVGLTMRTIETLGARRKIITSNKDIVNYDFYRPENVYVYEGNIDFENIFFHSNYVDISDVIYEKYSLKNWLRNLTESKSSFF